VRIGEVFDYAGGACPLGSLEANGSTTNLTTTYPSLSSALGTIWGNPGGGQFALPDLRGRAEFGRDSGGSGRITAAGGNFDGTTVGNTGGQQNKVIATSNMPPDPGHVHTGIFMVNSSSITTAGNITATGATTALTTGGSAATITTTSATTGLSTGANNPLPTLSNAAIVLKCIQT